MCTNFNMCLICKYLFHQIIMIPIVLSVIARAVVESKNCFGGVETFEKTAVTDFDGSVNIVGTLLHQENVALTRDCINLCKQQPQCQSFGLNYAKFRCSAYSQNSKRNRDRLVHAVSTNFFEKVCLNGISREAFDGVCGHERLWSFERVKNAFIEGFVEKENNNIGSREECAKTCLMETSFICRSADYDEVKRICRMSKEDRRTQPQAFRQLQESSRDYLENQCAPPGPSSCVYRTKPDFSVLSMDSLHFATTSDDCQMQCDRESSFNCRSYSYISNRCVLSGDDGVSLVGTTLPSHKGAIYGERTCVAELCTNGIFTYEKITGHVLRSAVTTAVELPNIGTLGATGWCRESCDSANLNCPAFSVNYQSTRCEKLDRNSQGRTGDLIPLEGESYFEKICLRVPQIMSQCQDKYWAFERILGHELAPVLYIKTLNFVQSRRDCEEYCLQEREFPCRSALYNDETTECRLSQEDRRTSPGSYYRSRSTKINYLENQCVRSHSTCPYEKTLDAYPTYTDLVETNGVSSHEVCESYCNDNKRFLCRSFAYYSSNGQCFISGDDRSSAGSAAIQKRSGIIYFERKCPRMPTTGSSPSSSSITSSQLTNASPSVSPSENPSVPTNPSPSPTLPTTSSTGTGSSGHPTNETSGGGIGSPVTKFPASLIPTLPPKGNGFSPQFDPFAAQPPSHVSSVSGIPSRGPEVPRALETDLHNVHSQGIRPQPSKCGPHARYLFEKVTSFEPIGGHLTLLYSDLQNPGIVTECSRRCEHSSQCRAFVVDYYHQSCHGLFENSSVGNLDLRLSMGKDYFEGFCVPNHIECNKFWPFDRIIDQASIGVTPQDRIRFISRGECRKRCLEERKYKCLSASYDSSLHECRLYSEDRNSGSLTLLFTKGTDYMENQCAIETFSCRYHPIERDISIVSVTKSVRGTSTFHCEQACDHEKEFNCRSYTYLDNPDGHNAPGGNLCLLSSDNRATSHQGSMQFRPRALYAEKDCVNLNQRSRVPSTPLVQPTQPSLAIFPPTLMPKPNQQINESPQSSLTHTPAHCGPNQFTFEKTFGHDLRYARRERAPMPPRLGIIIHCQDECLRRGERCKAFIVEYGQLQSCFFLDESAGENRNQLNKIPDTAYVEKVCLREKTCGKMWTFERVIGHTLEESADKDITSVLLRTDCEDLCLAEKTFSCRSATFDYTKRLCKLFSETRRSRPNSFKATNEFIDYFENQCVTEPSTCQYRDFQESFFPYIDRITSSFSLADCQRQCDAERLFPCRSINFETFTRDCALSSEDMVTLGMGPNTVIPRRNSLYSEKGNCEQVSVQCNQQDMVLTLNFDSPFNGRVYAKGSPSQCFVVGTGQTQLQFAISLGSRCGTRQEGTNNFANEVIVQQHAVIMTDSDRTIRVLCSFETGDQTVTLGNQNIGKPGGIDVTALMNARTRLEHPITSIVTNTAPPPAVMMRIVDRSGHDAQIVGLGDELVLRIELKDSSSAFAIFARNLYARSSNGESLFLIDNTGCPTDAAIFPALQVDLRDKRSLYSTFKAFRFPSTGVVNFEVQIRFCQERCEPVKCTSGSESFGKRRKRSTNEETDDERDSDEYVNETESLRQEDSLQPILIPNDEAILAVKKRTKIANNKSENNITNYESLPENFNETVINKNRSALMEERFNSSVMTEPSHRPQSYTNHGIGSDQDKNLELPLPTISSLSRSSLPPYAQEWSSNGRDQQKDYNQNYPIHGYQPSFQPPLAPPPISTTHLPTHPYPLSQEYYQRNNWNHNPYHNYNNAYNPNPNQFPYNYNVNHNRTNYWHQFPQEVPRFQSPDVVTPYASVSQLPSHYLNQNEQMPPQAKPSTSRPSRPPLPPSYLEWGDSRPSRPPPRPSPRNKIIATTERPQPQEVPLSLAIMVGEEKDSNMNENNNNINNNNNNWKQSNKVIQMREPHIEECEDCNTGLAVFYTALIVSLIHIGLIAGSYFYMSKLKTLRSKFSTEVFDSEEDITRIHHHNNGTQPLNDNVFYGNRELGFRGSLPGINASYDSSHP